MLVSLPGGVFTQAGAGVKTNLLFFTGKPTERVWYYDLSDGKVTKRQPLTLTRLDEFFTLLPERARQRAQLDLSREEIQARNYASKRSTPTAPATLCPHAHGAHRRH